MNKINQGGSSVREDDPNITQSNNKGFILGALVSFGATFFGVLLGFIVSEWDKENSEQVNFEELRRVAIDECFETNRQVDIAFQQWTDDRSNFINSPNDFSYLLNSIQPPIMFLDAIERNLNFSVRMQKETYTFLLPVRHEILSSILTYNSVTRRIGDMMAFRGLPAFQNEESRQTSQVVMERDVKRVIATLEEARSTVFFGCVALVLDKCSTTEQLKQFHDNWNNPEVEIEMSGNENYLSCDAALSDIEYKIQ